MIDARNSETLSLRLADATLAAGAPATAVRVLDERLRQHLHDVAALIRRGHALTALGRPSDAAQDFARALTEQPGSMEALIGLANARAAEGRATDAEAVWRQALARQPNDVRCQTGLAIALDLQTRHEEAQALYRAVLKRAPDNAVATADLGLSLAVSGHAAEGLPLLESAASGEVGHEPTAAAARLRHNLAVGLMMAGDEGAARRVLSRDLDASRVSAALSELREFAAAR